MLRIQTALVLAASMLAGAAQAAPGGATIPNYNINAACRALSAIPEARIVDTTQPDVTQHCIDAEHEAREQLLKQWSQFSAADRNMCVGVSGTGQVDPVYTELVTCLEMARDSRQLTNRGVEPATQSRRHAQNRSQ